MRNYGTTVKTYARELRQNQTPEERRLWYRFLSTFHPHFRRQQVVGNYILDFYCATCHLAVELDGSQHYAPTGMDKDSQRTAYLEEQGISVLRFTNTDVKQNFEGVCLMIEDTVKQRCSINSSSQQKKPHEEYTIVEGADNIDSREVMRLLKMTYWADKRPIEQIEKSMRHSACYGIRLASDDTLVGFARVISDFATTYYLCDVIIDTAYQHMGLGTALISHITSLSDYANLRGVLITKNAHNLYRKFGYEVLNDRVMVKPNMIY